MKGKTLVFCTSYIEDHEAWTARYKRWLDHHAQFRSGSHVFCIIDDGSPYLPPPKSIATYAKVEDIPGSVSHPFVLTFAEHFGRQALTVYPGWWRSFLASLNVAQRLGCTKILHIESDFYILTRKMFRELEKVDSGWWAAWCPKYSCPETAMQVICDDQFNAMKLLASVDLKRFENQFAEQVLSFTGILNKFVGDRYSEFRRKIPTNADYAAQVVPEQGVWVRSS